MLITKDNLQQIQTNMGLGKKAKYLLDLYKMSRGIIFDIPDFAIIPGNIVSEYNKTNNFDIVKNQDYINFMTPDPQIINSYKDFVTQQADLLEDAFLKTNSAQNPRIRTSLCLDELYAGSFAGVNHTIDCETPDRSDFLKTAVPLAIAGLYKPYSNWYLSRKNINMEDRDCCLMFSKFIPNTTAGIAHIDNNGASIFIGLNNKDKEEKIEFDFQTDTSSVIRHKKLFNALKFIRNKTPEENIEVEFLIDNNSDKFNIMQIRGVETNKNLSASKEEVDIFFKNKIINLVNADNSNVSIIKALKYVINPNNTTFLISHENRKAIKHLDATSLVIALNDMFPKDQINILAAYDNIAPSTHLMTAIREDPLYNFRIIPRKDLLQTLSNKVIKTKQKEL